MTDMGHRHRLLLALAGALLVAAFAPWQQVWLVWPSFAVLWWALHRFPAQGFQVGYCFGLGLFLAGLPWLYTSLHDFGGLLAPVAVLLTVLFSAFMAFYPALACLLFSRLKPTVGMAPLALAACWTLLEWLRSWLFTGFPWLSLGYVLSDTPLSGLFSLGGTWLAGFVLVLLAVLPAHLWQQRHWQAAWPGLLFLLCLPPAMWWQPRTQPAGPPLSVALLQGNYSQDIKWDPHWIPREVAWYVNTTLEQRARLILWPETAIPGTLTRHETILLQLDETLWQRNQGVLAGLIEDDGQAIYNSLVGLGRLQGRYRKHHLVLLGEYFPFRSWLQLLPGLVIPASDFSPGPARQTALKLGEYTLLANICYEDVFGNEMRASLLQAPETGLLINASNDAWFGRTAPWQHLQMARMRAVELGRPMLRVTNTGITAVIDPRGRVVQRLPQFQAGVLQTKIRPYQGETLFLRAGSGWVQLLSLVLVVLSHRRASHVRRRNTQGR